jgi:hypothetical protein
LAAQGSPNNAVHKGFQPLNRRRANHIKGVIRADIMAFAMIGLATAPNAGAMKVRSAVLSQNMRCLPDIAA